MMMPWCPSTQRAWSRSKPSPAASSPCSPRNVVTRTGHACAFPTIVASLVESLDIGLQGTVLRPQCHDHLSSACPLLPSERIEHLGARTFIITIWETQPTFFLVLSGASSASGCSASCHHPAARSHATHTPPILCTVAIHRVHHEPEIGYKSYPCPVLSRTTLLLHPTHSPSSPEALRHLHWPLHTGVVAPVLGHRRMAGKIAASSSVPCPPSSFHLGPLLLLVLTSCFSMPRTL
jgi:hypothetical protein